MTAAARSSSSTGRRASRRARRPKRPVTSTSTAPPTRPSGSRRRTRSTRSTPSASAWCPTAPGGGEESVHSRQFNTHHHASRCGVADLFEPGVGEHLAGADVELAPRDLLARLGDHRIRLERAGAAFAGEADAGAAEWVGEPAPAIALADGEARHRPDALVVLVLGAAGPRDPRAAQ